MIEEKDETAAAGPAGMPANDPGEGAVDELADAAAAASPEARVAAIEAELADTRDHLLRALADTENVRRRYQRERDDAQKYAISDFAKDLLSAVDNLRRALDAMPEAEVADPRTRSLLRRGRGDRARAVGRVRAPRPEAHRPQGRALRPQFPPGDLRGRAARRAGRDGHRGAAARLCAARPAAAPGHGRRRQGRCQAATTDDAA